MWSIHIWLEKDGTWVPSQQGCWNIEKQDFTYVYIKQPICTYACIWRHTQSCEITSSGSVRVFGYFGLFASVLFHHYVTSILSYTTCAIKQSFGEKKIVNRQCTGNFLQVTWIFRVRSHPHDVPKWGQRLHGKVIWLEMEGWVWLVWAMRWCGNSEESAEALWQIQYPWVLVFKSIFIKKHIFILDLFLWGRYRPMSLSEKVYFTHILGPTGGGMTQVIRIPVMWLLAIFDQFNCPAVGVKCNYKCTASLGGGTGLRLALQVLYFKAKKTLIKREARRTKTCFFKTWSPSQYGLGGVTMLSKLIAGALRSTKWGIQPALLSTSFNLKLNSVFGCLPELIIQFPNKQSNLRCKWFQLWGVVLFLSRLKLFKKFVNKTERRFGVLSFREEGISTWWLSLNLGYLFSSMEPNSWHWWRQYKQVAFYSKDMATNFEYILRTFDQKGRKQVERSVSHPLLRFPLESDLSDPVHHSQHTYTILAPEDFQLSQQDY